QTGATLNGTVNPNGSTTTARFEYGLAIAYGSMTPVQAMGSGTIALPIGGGAITGLTCNTIGRASWRATNLGGARTGADATFRTSACQPTGVQGSAPAITQTGATLNGTVNPNGSTTTARFEYGLAIAYGSMTPVQAMGSGTIALPIGGGAITGLTCN